MKKSFNRGGGGKVTLRSNVKKLQIYKPTKELLYLAGNIIAERAKRRIKDGWMPKLNKIVPADLKWVLGKTFSRGKRRYGARSGIYSRMIASRGTPTPLYKTGRLMNSIGITGITKNTVTVEAKVPYAKIHQKGGTHNFSKAQLDAFGNKYGVLFKYPQKIKIQKREFLVCDKQAEKIIMRESTALFYGRKVNYATNRA